MSIFLIHSIHIYIKYIHVSVSRVHTLVLLVSNTVVRPPALLPPLLLLLLLLLLRHVFFYFPNHFGGPGLQMHRL